jgi:biotin transport system substrate-specific component
MNKPFFRSLVKVFSVAAAMVAGAKIHYSLLGTPGTFQTFFLCFSALYFLRSEALAGQLLYLGLGFFLPVFSAEYFGAAVFLGDSAGFLYAFPLAALFLAHFSKPAGKDLLLIFSLCVIAHAFILTGGFLWVWLTGRMELTVAIDRAVIFLLPGASCFILSL